MLLHVIRGFKDAGPTLMEFLSNHFSIHTSDNSTKLTKVVFVSRLLLLSIAEEDESGGYPRFGLRVVHEKG